MVLHCTGCHKCAVTFCLAAGRNPFEAASVQLHLEEAVLVRWRLAVLDAWPCEPAYLLRRPSAAGSAEPPGSCDELLTDSGAGPVKSTPSAPTCRYAECLQAAAGSGAPKLEGWGLKRCHVERYLVASEVLHNEYEREAEGPRARRSAPPIKTSSAPWLHSAVCI